MRAHPKRRRAVVGVVAEGASQRGNPQRRRTQGGRGPKACRVGESIFGLGCPKIFRGVATLLCFLHSALSPTRPVTLDILSPRSSRDRAVCIPNLARTQAKSVPNSGTVCSFRARPVLAATRPFRQQLPVMAEILLREEYLLTAVAVLRDVVRVSRQKRPRRSCHTVPP